MKAQGSYAPVSSHHQDTEDGYGSRQVISQMPPSWDQVESTSIHKQKHLPDFDKSLGTRMSCIIALIFGALLSAGCLIAGILIFKQRPAELSYTMVLSAGGTEGMTFVLNLVLTLCTDSMAYLHATSLRWTLYHENRLQFNTNIRLLSSARESPPNRWYTNIMAMTCLIICYAATSQLFTTYVELGITDQPVTSVNATALCALGFGLLGQVVIGVWCIAFTLQHVATFSSNPLNTTVAALHNQIKYRPNRCMLSLYQSDKSDSPSIPLKRQQSARYAKASVRAVVLLVWGLALLAGIWTVAIIFVTRHSTNLAIVDGATPWTFTFTWTTYNGAIDWAEPQNAVSLFMSPELNNFTSSVSFPYWSQFILGIIFVCGIQGAQTIGLHCVELVVNLSRDEDTWRRADIASSPKHAKRHFSGARLASSPLLSAILSWQNIILFSLKAGLHWLLGQSLRPSWQWNSIGLQCVAFDMNYARLIVYTIVALFLAIFTTYLAYRRPGGSQPSAWGHIQTLADLIDDWELSPDGRLWWGDKGVNSFGIRHAGTSGYKDDLGLIHLGAEYSGK